MQTIPAPPAPIPMSIDFYYGPGTCSLAVHIALHETAAPFTARRLVLTEGEHLRPAFLAINPRGRVPAVVRDGEVLTESLALLLWLDAAYPHAGLLPTEAWARGRAIEWLSWLNGTVHGTHFARIFRPGRFSTDPAVQEGLQAAGRAAVAESFDEIEARLAGAEAGQGRVQALASGWSVVDAYLLVLYRWGQRIGLDVRRRWPCYAALVRAQATRASVVAAFASEGLNLEDLG